MSPENMLLVVDCCSCGKNLAAIGSRFVNFLQTGKAAKWDYPTVGNVITGDAGEAVAIVCDHCLNQPSGAAIQSAVEFRNQDYGTSVHYHDLRHLADFGKSPQLQQMEAAIGDAMPSRNGGGQ